jgi:hypothetical protein
MGFPRLICGLPVCPLRETFHGKVARGAQDEVLMKAPLLHSPNPPWSLAISCAALFSVIGASCGPLGTPEVSTPGTTAGIAGRDDLYALVYLFPPDEAIDIVFVPDDDYGDMAVPAEREGFLDAAVQIIQSGFWKNFVYFENLFRVNYWYVIGTGDVQPPLSGICPRVTWPDLSDAPFVEMVVLLHPNYLRDCAWGNRVTAWASRSDVIVHESGHAVFKLPDEYCCDGGYWEHHPILYRTEAACESDTITGAGGGGGFYEDEIEIGTSWKNCDSFVDVRGVTWWRSEDLYYDIMRGGVDEFGPADLWRVDQLLRLYLNQAVAVIPPSPPYGPTPWP